MELPCSQAVIRHALHLPSWLCCMRGSAVQAIDDRPGSGLQAADRALLSVGQYLLKQGYHFTTVSPASHARVNARRVGAPTLRDIFGWSRPFERGDLPDSVMSDLVAAGALLEDGLLLSALRFSSLDISFSHTLHSRPIEPTQSSLGTHRRNESSEDGFPRRAFDERFDHGQYPRHPWRWPWPVWRK